MTPRRLELLFAVFAGAFLAATVLQAAILDDSLVPADHRWSTLHLLSEEGFPVDARSATYGVSIHQIHVRPGDVVHVPRPAINNGEEFHVYVVEGGEGAALLERETPEHVYFHAFPSEPVELVRPEPPGEGIRNYDRHLVALDVVWVADEAELAPYGSDAASRLESWHRTVVEASEDHRPLYVVSARHLALSPWWTAATWTLAAVAAAAGIGAFVARKRAREEAPASPLEAALGVARRAGDYLRRLRDLLIFCGVLLALMFVPMTSFVSDITNDNLAHWPSDLVGSIRVAYFVAYALVMIVWLAQLLAVSREIRRYREATQDEPLGL